MLVGIVSCVKNDRRKARERELANSIKTDEINADKAVETLTPLRDNNEGTCREREGKTPVTTACPERP